MLLTVPINCNFYLPLSFQLFFISLYSYSGPPFPTLFPIDNFCYSEQLVNAEDCSQAVSQPVFTTKFLVSRPVRSRSIIPRLSVAEDT